MKTLAISLLLLLLPIAADAASVTLLWTAPGDDGNVGFASEYDIRHSMTPVGTDTLAWWNAATQLVGEPAPDTCGTTQFMVVTGLVTGTHYFMICTADEIPNWSCGDREPHGWSNVASVVVPESMDETPPRDIRNFRTSEPY